MLLSPKVLVTIVVYACLAPHSAFAQEFQQGIKADYYNGVDFNFFVLSRVEKKIGFSRKLKSPAPGVGKEYFSIRYSGSIRAPRTGLYNFYVVADDGVRVRVNHELIINAWVEQEATSYVGSIMLDKDEVYDIDIEYYNSIVHSVFNIRWELPMEQNQLFNLGYQPEVVEIPTSVLTPSRSNAKQRRTLLVGRVPVSAERSVVEEVKPVTQLARKKRPVSQTEIIEHKPIILKTVVFDQQSAVLKAEASLELDNLIKYLKTYETKKIQIAGYTDYAGDSLDNQVLSEQRAKTVAQYLARGGIDGARISSKGFGSRFPLVVSKNLKERSANRRVEFTIVD